MSTQRMLVSVMTTFLMCLGTASADDRTATTIGPVLGGHLFQPLVGHQMPFVMSSTRLTLGGGITSNLKLPIVRIGERIVLAPEGSLAFIATGAEHEQRIKEWLSVYVGVDVVGRLGTDVKALLSQGVNAVTSFDLGWKVRAYQSERVLLTMSLDLVNGSVTTVDVDRWVRGIIDSGGVTDANPLVDSKPTITAGVAAHCAYAVSPAIGLMATVSGVYGESAIRGGASQIFLNAGANVNVDMLPLVGIPVATTVGMLYRQNPSVDDASTRSDALVVSLRIGTTVSNHFALGVQLNAQNGEIGNGTHVLAIGGAVDMRFYY
jgi:hypothetical protein